MLPGLKTTPRPTLEPLWTRGHSTKASHTRYSPSAQLSASPISPGCLPSPLYPQFKDGMAMKERDQSLVRSLCHHAPSLSSPTSLLPQLEQFSILPPMNATQADSPLSPELPELSSPGSSSASSETSDTDGSYYDAGKTKHTNDKFSTIGRRTTLPAPKTANPTRNQHVASQPSPDAYIIARSLRRPSTAPGSSPVARSPTQTTLRAVIRPKDPTKPVFLIQRTLDLNSLKSTSRQIASSPSSPTKRRPLPVLPRRGKAKAARAPRSVPATPTSAAGDKEYQSLIRDAKAVPVHLATLSALPALTALLSSGHIHAGDVIYLAVPNADAFAATLRHVSMGKGGAEECSPAVMANISYLGGRV
ncbi:hypothetical protein F5Y18DRAFT_202990 [Xylariaceae sp. FL1019]|nr:hypothetical protein F5Y18DRAFT_202990 [Xylariaceae sp. FL1019]